MAASGALAGIFVVVPVALPPVLAADRTGLTPSGDTKAAKPGSHAPRPPQLPRNFRGTGKWIVRDLGITVPFTWAGRDGDSQMVAGGPQYPIWFTNLIYRNSLYTLTYKWPGLNEHQCSRIPGFNLGLLNQKLKTARFVGRETLQRNPRRQVNHWRVGAVVPQLPPGNHLRFPLGIGDIYVDQHNPGTFWQVLQFGVQNLYDPELDEWLVMDRFEHRPGRVALPRRCLPPS
ncbi:hypothetical protein [Actinomadura xylanilytica]|uniref:hypothetical protein n=1 Tax=Actinomadura xylanilytica TaxID=887459 RepID=UPI00255ACE41|nr:hypothetical protein [Actinomadura xylanilytica]MDL4773077.1 hypothetical protein [Actinomadura xylanilytica]